MAPHFSTRLAITPYAKDRWFLTEPLVYTTMHFGFPVQFVVPETNDRGGWSTDLSSIPWIVQPIIKKSEETHAPGVLHDWLCTRNPRFTKRGLDGITRRHADKIFHEALLSKGAIPEKAWIMYQAVRLYSFTRPRS